MQYCFGFFQIMKLEIDEIAAPRSFIFLWCGSGEGLDLGRVVRWWFFFKCFFKIHKKQQYVV